MVDAVDADVMPYLIIKKQKRVLEYGRNPYSNTPTFEGQISFYSSSAP
jgi:hypothetical protein